MNSIRCCSTLHKQPPSRSLLSPRWMGLCKPVQLEVLARMEPNEYCLEFPSTWCACVEFKVERPRPNLRHQDNLGGGAGPLEPWPTPMVIADGGPEHEVYYRRSC